MNLQTELDKRPLECDTTVILSSKLSSDSTSISSSQSSSQASFSSSALSTGSSKIILSGPQVILEQRIMRKKDDNSIGGSASSIDDEFIISSSEDVKQYRNSPFGLTHHYLTMPDNDQSKTAKMFNKNYTINNHTSSPCDLSVLGNSHSSAGSLSSPWIGYQYHERPLSSSPSRAPKAGTAIHSSQAKQLNQIGLVGLNDHFKGQNVPVPAGDAGLDAERCNAKMKVERCESFFHPGANNLLVRGSNESNKAQESGGLLIRFSSIMYATFLVILGCILHVSELRQKSKNSSDHIYTTIVACIGMIWLFFLQMDLQRYKNYATKYILIETIFIDQRQRKRELARSSDLSGRSTTSTSSSTSLVNDRMSMNTEVIFKKTAYKMYQRRAALERYGGSEGGGNCSQNKMIANKNCTSRKLSQQPSSSYGEPSDIYKAASGVSVKESLSSGIVSTNNSDRDNLIPAYKFLHGKMGANFYLKCGMAAFCFGHVIHEGLRFGQQLYFFGAGNVHCRDLAALVAHLITPLYSFYQLFMMFKYSNLVINRHKVLASFGLMHIIGTSVTFWFRTIMEEAFEDFVHKMDYFKTNKPQTNMPMTNQQTNNDPNLVSTITSVTKAIKTGVNERSDWHISSSDNQNITLTQSLMTLMASPISSTITPQLVRHLPDSYACAQNTLLTTKSMNALPYLYPFTIEYNLLLAATFLSLYFNIGKIGVPGKVDGSTCKPPFTSSSLSFPNMNTKPKKSSSSSPSSHVESSDNFQTAIRIRESNEKEIIGEYKSNFVVNADCHSANKGLFCGFFVLLVTLVTIVIFFVTINKPIHIQLGIKINLIQEATLTALILMVTLAGFKQVVKLNRNPYLKDKVTTDDVLMLIPLPFFFIHSLLSFRAETASMSSGSISYFSSLLLQGNHSHDSMTTRTGNLQSIFWSTNNNNNNDNNDNDNAQIESRSRLNNLLAGHPNETNGRFVEVFINSTNNSNSNGSNRNGRNISSIDSGSSNSSQIDHFKLITVALNIIVMIEVLVQTNFIIDGMRRCSESRYLRFKKPGRELITFAILLNITYWIVATFETKSVEQYKTEIEYYGPLPYMFISHTTLPVMLFYRYHSSVCLAEIWNRAYKPPKKR